MKHVVLAAVVLTLLTACSARQEGKSFQGSTEQRLVTHSIDRLMGLLPEEDLKLLEGQKVHLGTHFVVDSQVVKYASARLALELQERFQVRLVEKPEADYVLDMFFTSLGTDREARGISIPIVNLSDPEQSTSINILAVDMYHGLAEGYFYLTDVAQGSVVKRGKIKSRVRTDNFATPIFSLPVNHLD